MTIISARLGELEEVIDRGRKSFIEVGNALAEIRDSRLYRQLAPTFEDYCQERWGFTRVHAHRLVEAAEVVTQMLPNGNTALPNNEAQARQLARLPDPEARQEVWEKVVETDGEHVTARALKEVVDTVIEQMPVVSSLPAHREQTVAERTEAILAALPRTSQQEALETRAWITRRMVRAREITEARPEQVAPLLDEMTTGALRIFLTDMETWSASMKDALKPRLYAIGGEDG